jgi:HEAT repeat protein
MTDRDLVLFYKMIGQPKSAPGLVCGACGASSFELVPSLPEDQISPATTTGEVEELRLRGDVHALSDIAINGAGDAQKAAWDALEGLGQVVEGFAHGLKHPGVEIRRAMALNLGYVADPRAVAYLVQALGDADSTVRQNAIVALERIGGPAAAQALRSADTRQSER